MNVENETIYIIAAIIAAVVIISVWLTKKVGFTGNKEGVSFFASKQDNVDVEGIQKSKVTVKNREGQDVSVKTVSDDSDVNIT